MVWAGQRHGNAGHGTPKTIRNYALFVRLDCCMQNSSQVKSRPLHCARHRVQNVVACCVNPTSWNSCVTEGAAQPQPSIQPPPLNVRAADVSETAHGADVCEAQGAGAARAMARLEEKQNFFLEYCQAENLNGVV